MIHQTQVVLDRAAALSKSGDSLSAIELCEAAFQEHVAVRQHDGLAELAVQMGWAHYWSGSGELAEEYHYLAQVLASLSGDTRVEARALNGLAVVHQGRGEMLSAESAYTEALGLADSAHDSMTVANIHQNLGILASIRGEFTEAQIYYTKALQGYEFLGHDKGVSGVLNNLGMLFVHTGELPEARKCLSRAIVVARRNRDLVTEGIIHINQTEMHLAGADYEQARISCDHAFEIASRTGDNRHKAEVMKFYGVIYRETGKPHLSEAHLRQAIDLSVDSQSPLTEAEAWRELSLVLRTEDRNREALAALNRAHELFQLLQAKKWQAEIDERISLLQEDFLSLVSAWGESIEAKDRYTRGHCQRVAEYACEIARRCGLPEAEEIWFRMGAFLHDVGKTEIPEEILNKPGRLTDSERIVIEQHTIIGDQILSTIEFPWDIRPMVRSHHERWDGSGYPDQLQGSAIPLSARILRIADVFDALTTSRSYRRPLTAEEALDIMRGDEGSFDPELFEIFLELFPELLPLVGGRESESEL